MPIGPILIAGGEPQVTPSNRCGSDDDKQIRTYGVNTAIGIHSMDRRHDQVDNRGHWWYSLPPI